jgi:8-oxo-dGTP diphosphatase
MEVVCAILSNRDGHILLAKRPAHKTNGGLWEFPGGKLEKGETLQSALKREIKEELGIEIDIQEAFLSVSQDYAFGRVCLHAFVCTMGDAKPQALEHDEICFVPCPSLLDMDLAAANIPIARALSQKGDRI